MGAVLSEVRRRSSQMDYNRSSGDRVGQHRSVAPLVSRAVSPHVSSFERSGKFVKSIDTSKEDRSSQCSESAKSESFENEVKEKKRPSSHSSDTSYGARSLPEVEDYGRWREDHRIDDINWIKAVRAFNARQKTWKRSATPARSLRRLGCRPTGLKWTQCAREVYKRGPAAEWVVTPDLHQEQQLRKYKRIDEDVDNQASRLALLTLEVSHSSDSSSLGSYNDDDDASTVPERSEITTSSDDERMPSSSKHLPLCSMLSPCPNGILRLGYTAENFPTFFQDENTGLFGGVSVIFWKEFAKQFNCHRIEYLQMSNEDYNCTNRNCPDAVAMGIDRGNVFADADGSVLDPDNVLQHTYSSLSDASKLIFVEARTPLRDGPLDLSFYVVYTPEAAGLLILCFICRTILNMIQRRIAKREVSSPGVANLIQTVLNLVDFVNRLAQLFVVLLLFSFYQCFFNGNSAMELLEPPTQFVELMSRLRNGTERLVVNEGLLMSNELSTFGPGTTSLENTIDRFHEICTDSRATGLFYEDELTEMAFLTAQERSNCRLRRIVVDNSNILFLPRLRDHFERGMNFFYVMPRRTPKRVIEIVNRMLSTIFRIDLRAYYVRKLIPAKGIQAANQAVFGEKVEKQQFYFRPLSIHNIFYPLVFYGMGMIAALTSIIVERIVIVCTRKLGETSYMGIHRVSRRVKRAIGFRSKIIQNQIKPNKICSSLGSYSDQLTVSKTQSESEEYDELPKSVKSFRTVINKSRMADAQRAKNVSRFVCREIDSTESGLSSPPTEVFTDTPRDDHVRRPFPITHIGKWQWKTKKWLRPRGCCTIM